jgi:hypothetical protein
MKGEIVNTKQYEIHKTYTEFILENPKRSRDFDFSYMKSSKQRKTSHNILDYFTVSDFSIQKPKGISFSNCKIENSSEDSSSNLADESQKGKKRRPRNKSVLNNKSLLEETPKKEEDSIDIKQNQSSFKTSQKEKKQFTQKYSELKPMSDKEYIMCLSSINIAASQKKKICTFCEKYPFYRYLGDTYEDIVKSDFIIIKKEESSTLQLNLFILYGLLSKRPKLISINFIIDSISKKKLQIIHSYSLSNLYKLENSMIVFVNLNFFLSNSLLDNDASLHNAKYV